MSLILLTEYFPRIKYAERAAKLVTSNKSTAYRNEYFFLQVVDLLTISRFHHILGVVLGSE
jgi:hypothetical protein